VDISTLIIIDLGNFCHFSGLAAIKHHIILFKREFIIKVVASIDGF